ncbi:sigma-70 family RNA polymerase sigma factor [Oceanobacillus sp. CFH 90083]|uniref:sigma-70 family RNA polymerase sigma factor n=1 Tax=Oceanobacillus sp. CFH 90083 TaxID=2592336 RepID=UPI00128D6417|nr:sigma-70 family RNA polymerase sigma factor [Oceanobacillus sp. CFH 90083]
MEKLNLLSKCKSQMNQPVIKNFLNDENNYALFNKALQEPSNTESIKKLDEAFQRYYKSIKILGYISKLIYFYSIDFDKKRNNHKNKEVYIKDKDSKIDDETLQEVYFSSKKDLTFEGFQNHQSFLDRIEDEKLYKNIKSLKPLQLRILELIYVQGLSNKEAASVLGESEQTISYNHRAALKKLKNNLEEMVNYG